MNRQLVQEIANAVLYEGYILYPYRASAMKNRQRWNFGVLYPPDFVRSQSGAEAWNMQTECLAQTSNCGAAITVYVRFLQLLERDDKWQEGKERSIEVSGLNLAELVARPVRQSFAYPVSRESDERFVRTQQAIKGLVDIQAEELQNGLFRIRVVVSNTTALDEAVRCNRERALLQSLASAHTILESHAGEFISLLDPPEQFRAAAGECKNIGTWPVLVGETGARDAMLSSPIVLYDYPQIAPESAGALFDGTEIDEILTLRIMTLTEEEKREMGEVDGRAQEILARTESMPPEQLMKMHGALRGLRRAGEETA